MTFARLFGTAVRALLSVAALLGLCCLLGACSESDDDDAATSDDDDNDNDNNDNDSADDDSTDDDDDDNDDDNDCTPLFPNELVTAHRGATKFAPENTVRAIEKAFEIGADIVEIDVQNTLDGAYVLMHDDTVDRTTNGTGTVAEMTLAEIQELVVTSWMYPWIHETIRVPTFAEALQAIAAAGGQVDVDMKTEEPEGAIQIIVEMGLEDRCFVYSPDMAKLDRVRSVSMDVRIQPSSGSVEQTQEILDHFDPDPEHIELQETGFTADNIALIQSAGAVVFMDALGWRDYLGMVGIHEAWLHMMKSGIAIIQTDFPPLLARYRDSLCE
jgi:glycerophosphoryl diester phosphodiesterase